MQTAQSVEQVDDDVQIRFAADFENNNMIKNTGKNIGLALSGGCGKGAYQIGALMAIADYLSPTDFSMASCASIGSLNAFAFLTGRIKIARKIWENLKLKGLKRSIISVMRSEFVNEVIEKYIFPELLPCTFYLPLLNSRERCLEYYDLTKYSSETVKQFLKAGISVPPINQGIRYNNKILYDGAVVDNIPIYPLANKKLDYIICVCFDKDFCFENSELDSRIIKITFPKDTSIRQSLDINHELIMKMIDDGYKRASHILSVVFAGGTDDLERIYNNIHMLNSISPDREYRITIDQVVTNLNHILKKIKRKEDKESDKITV